MAVAVQELPDDNTVGTYLLRWLTHMRSRVRLRTWQGYESLIRCHAVPGLGTTELDQLSPLDLQGLYGRLLERGLSAGTVLNLHLVLTNAFRQAVRWRLMTINPMDGVQPPRPRRPDAPTIGIEAAEDLLARLADTPMQLPAAVAIATGMRRGEILALRWSDLDAEFTVASVQRSLQSVGAQVIFEPPKTKRSRRSVVLPEFIRPYLHEQRQSQSDRARELGDAWQRHDLIVDRGDGAPLNPATLSAAWGRTLRSRGLAHVRFHDLRHAHATIMLQQGVHPKIVSERLGHAGIGITLDTYSHVLPSMQEGAVRAIDAAFSPDSEPTSRPEQPDPSAPHA
ncbi:MAG: site-specific integrase [Actinomycetota bacterium]